GRFVAFQSRATNLVADEVVGPANVYIFDRQTGTTQLARPESGSASSFGRGPAISADGRVVGYVFGIEGVGSVYGHTAFASRLVTLRHGDRVGDLDFGNVDARPDLAVTLSGTPDPAVAGAPLTYRITVSNLGGGPAANVILSATLPGGFALASGSSA